MTSMRDPRAAVRLVWLLTFVVFAGVGVGLVWWPSAQTVDADRSAAALYYDEANRNEDEVRHAEQLRKLQERIAGDLRTIMPAGSTSAETSELLRLLSEESKSYDVTVKTVVPGAKPVPRGPFETLPLEITLSGRFASVLHVVSDLTRRELLLEMNDVNISSPEGHDAGLAVVLHATLYRFRGRLPSGEADAASGPV